MVFWLRVLLLIAVVFAVTPALAQVAVAPEQRLALVIGNGAYPGQSLKNAPADARAVASSLRKLGFAVIERIDAGKKAMEDAVLEFGEKLRAGGVGLFYYAGHGLQVRGRNYLVPIDASLPSEASVRVQAVDVDLVLEQLTEAQNRANLVILDACRNNPFVAKLRGAPSGLAAIDAARGTLIAYSTAPGKVAADGDGKNSPYTAALVKTLDEPGLKAEDVFKRVRTQVADATKGTQTPWESSSLTGDLIINLNVTINTPPAAASVPSRDPADVAFWTSIQASTDPQDYEDYLAQFPKGTFANLGKRRLSEINRKLQATAQAEAARKAAEDTERQHKEAEAEKQRLAAVVAERKRQASEEERQRKIAEEADRKRLAAESEKRRLAAAEAERQRKAAEDSERKRLAAEEAQRKRKEAEAERKRRADDEAEALRLQAEADRQRALERERLALQEAERRTATATPPPQQQAALPRSSDGTWTGVAGPWRMVLVIRDQQFSGTITCHGNDATFSGKLGANASVNTTAMGNGVLARKINGQLPRISIGEGGQCGSISIDLTRQ